jgi:hypothetical protein
LAFLPPQFDLVLVLEQEKVSYDDYNLAVIVTFPPYQKQAYGRLLMEFSSSPFLPLASSFTLLPLSASTGDYLYTDTADLLALDYVAVQATVSRLTLPHQARPNVHSPTSA